jgi:hypothetical protein
MTYNPYRTNERDDSLMDGQILENPVLQLLARITAGH